uniref:Uncharacterized protein n=1 Tax=Labrus bergylta TaxID=56723 RepID=A0A3Q3F3F1_9LABR
MSGRVGDLSPKQEEILAEVINISFWSFAFHKQLTSPLSLYDLKP